MKKFSFRKRLSTAVLTLIGVGFSVGLVTHHEAAQAQGVQNQINKMFDSMVNVSQPGVFETQRRGAIYGGRFTVKNKIFNENIVSFVPPSFSGSCNGIDIFGGSFSFINKEQFIQLLRSIASNAAGYAFQLALSNICESCMIHMAGLQDRIQALNQFMGNSCQLSKGIVNDTFSAMGLKTEGEESFTAMSKGLIDTVFAGIHTSSKRPAELNEENKDETYIGNIVWKQLKKNSANSWFSSGDDQLLETIMSISGSVIVHPLEVAPDSNKNSSTPKKEHKYTTLRGYKVHLQDLVEGGTVQIYSCAADKANCIIDGNLDYSIKIVGLRQQIIDVFNGSGSSIGVVEKMRRGINLSATEHNMTTALPSIAGSLIKRLSMKSPEAAREFVLKAAGAIASQMSYNLTRELIQSARTAMSNTDSSWVNKVDSEINTTMRLISEEYQQLLSQHGSLSEMARDFRALISVTDQFEMFDHLYRGGK